MSGRVPKERVSYAEFEEMVETLVDVVPSHYTGVVSINRGGLPLGVELSHSLQVPHGIVSATLYDDDSTNPEDQLEWHGQLLADVGEYVLLVDDIVDTGETLATAENRLHEEGLDVETAALHAKPGRSFDPNYYITETPNWVVYPWEIEMQP